MDNVYELIKGHFRLPIHCLPYLIFEHCLIDLTKSPCDNLMRAWFIKTSNLTKSQEELNKELLNILNAYPFSSYFDTEKENACNARLEKFFKNNENNQDLKTVLNLKRGESGFTVLHVVSSMALEEVKRVGDYYKDKKDKKI